MGFVTREDFRLVIRKRRQSKDDDRDEGGSFKRTNNHKQWSLILLYRLIHSENSLGKSLAVARIIIFAAVIRKCVCALYLRFVTCLFTMQDMKLKLIWLVFYVYLCRHRDVSMQQTTAIILKIHNYCDICSWEWQCKRLDIKNFIATLVPSISFCFFCSCSTDLLQSHAVLNINSKTIYTLLIIN